MYIVHVMHIDWIHMCTLLVTICDMIQGKLLSATAQALSGLRYKPQDKSAFNTGVSYGHEIGP